MVAFPEPKMVKTNGIELAVYEAGPKDGIPVVLCHGFPELAYSWRHQLPALGAAGYHVIAPDQRGYGRSARPPAVTDYDMEHLTGDLAGLLDAYGLKDAIFCGHDWGGLVVWQMPLFHPKRVRGVIGVNTPFMARGPMDPIAGMRAVFGEDMFSSSIFPEARRCGCRRLAKDVRKSMRFFMRKSGMKAEDYAKLPAERRNLALVKALEADEADVGRPGRRSFLTEEETQRSSSMCSSKHGLTGGINWYRNFTRNWEKSEGVVQKVNVPGLMIMAEDDVVLSPAMTEGMEQPTRTWRRR